MYSDKNNEWDDGNGEAVTENVEWGSQPAFKNIE
jgi:hypothetical protein